MYNVHAIFIYLSVRFRLFPYTYVHTYIYHFPSDDLKKERKKMIIIFFSIRQNGSLFCHASAVGRSVAKLIDKSIYSVNYICVRLTFHTGSIPIYKRYFDHHPIRWSSPSHSLYFNCSIFCHIHLTCPVRLAFLYVLREVFSIYWSSTSRNGKWKLSIIDCHPYFSHYLTFLSIFSSSSVVFVLLAMPVYVIRNACPICFYFNELS